MSDLIEELRIKAGVMESGERIKWGSDTELMYKAANEIERLRAENEALRNLCKQCADYLDINDLTNIAHGSIYHKELRKASEEQSE